MSDKSEELLKAILTNVIYIVEEYELPDLGVLPRYIGNQVFHDKEKAKEYFEEMKKVLDKQYAYKVWDSESKSVVEVRYSR